jgi:hypothetical protein
MLTHPGSKRDRRTLADSAPMKSWSVEITLETITPSFVDDPSVPVQPTGWVVLWAANELHAWALYHLRTRFRAFSTALMP